MEDQRSIIGQKIKKLLQTPSESMGVIIEEFGEAFWINLVAELENGQLIQVNEYDWTPFEGSPQPLIPAELVQENYTLKDIEGQTIVDIRRPREDGDEFAIVLENGLSFHCLGAPGGNFPWILGPE